MKTNSHSFPHGNELNDNDEKENRNVKSNIYDKQRVIQENGSRNNLLKVCFWEKLHFGKYNK
ncbi:hypothetical protein F070042J6_44930 [Bacteroides sp. f07]